MTKCLLCGSLSEARDHIFLECPVAKVAWNSSRFVLNLYQEGALNDWLLDFLSQLSADQQCLSVALVIMVQPQWSSTWRRADTPPIKSLIMLKNSSPNFGSVKLGLLGHNNQNSWQINFDGVVLESEGVSRVGVVVRDWHGSL
ncbi:unnamed protein product [Ilex paraguariensis]|uniref:Reverse transcriptase zinc-binding domain-containing protein n=1 Tax=Ilex paraguariensis TaxID=185542 RepID=A0ABC8REE3_9AQUA